MIRAGGGILQAASNARCLSVGSVDCTTVPAVLVRVTADSRDMCVLIEAHVSPVRSSVPRVSSNVQPTDQGSRRWNTGRSSSPVFISRKPRSAFNRSL